MKCSFELEQSTLAILEKSIILIFDTSIWIHLSVGKSQEAIRIRELLLRLRENEEIICPLTFSAILELRKQKGDSLQRTATLMESLSSNVSFRSLDQIFDSEISCFLEYMRSGELPKLSISEKFGPLLCYSSKSFSIDSSLTISQEKHLSTICQQISLTDYIQLLGDDSSYKMDCAPAYQKSNISRRKITGKSINKARRIEQEHIARSLVLPKLNEERAKLPIKEQLQITKKIGNLPKSKKHGSAIEYILTFMPALSAFVDVMTFSGLDINRKDSENDFYDREFLIHGLSYPYMFAAVDKWVASLIPFCDDKQGKKSKAFFGSLKELECYLEKI